MTKKLLLMLAVCLCGALSAGAQTMHAVVFCNTTDKDIGAAMKIDYRNALDKMETLAGLMELGYEQYALSGAKCTRTELKKLIDEMEVGPNDIVFTFYGGHGSHAMNNANDPWPQYCMNSGLENQSNWVTMAEFDRWIAAKNPRLRVIVANCCNKPQEDVTVKAMWAQGGRATDSQALSAEALKKLFSVSGAVKVTSSKLGQLSWCNPAEGGVFTSDFWDAMLMVARGNLAPDWKSLLAKVGEMTGQRTLRDSRTGQTYKQNPYYEISTGSGPIERPREGDCRDDPDGDLTIDQVFGLLCDRSVPVERRLELIEPLVQAFFPAGLEICTVANDMTTIVDHESVTDFLRRIIRDQRIRSVNVLDVEDNILFVHEVR